MLFDGRPASRRAVNRIDNTTATIVQSPEAQAPVIDYGDGILNYQREVGTLALAGEAAGTLHVTRYGSSDVRWRSVVSYLFAGQAPNISVYVGQEGAEPPAEIRYSDPKIEFSEQRPLTRGEARLVTHDLSATLHLQQIPHIADTMLDS